MNISRTYFFALIAVTFFIPLVPLQAGVIEAEGVAAIRPTGIEQARQAAINDAIDRASKQVGVEVRGASRVVGEGFARDSSQVRATVRFVSVKVIREWRDDENVHVRIAADTDQPNVVAVLQRKYRKKVTATPFATRTSYQTDDVDEISIGVPNELLRRLESAGEFLTRANSRHVLSKDATGLSHDTNAVIQLAKIYDSQFVISGEILDAGSLDEGGYLGFFKHKKRRFQIEIFVYDGLTGALVSRHRIDEFAEGDVVVGREKVFGSKAFLATNFGQAIGKAIDSAAEFVSRDLEPLPFTARVTRVAEGQVYINAGGTSLVAPGDELVVYRKSRQLSMRGVDPDIHYGVAETPVAAVSIVQVQPMFSIATLSPSAKGVVVEVGDLVRFDFAGQSRN